MAQCDLVSTGWSRFSLFVGLRCVQRWAGFKNSHQDNETIKAYRRATISRSLSAAADLTILSLCLAVHLNY